MSASKYINIMEPKLSDMYDVFCFMVVEEFLMKRNLADTLRSFREEWDRPSEDITLLSWYEVALKLRLPDIIASGSADKPVLANLVNVLVQESSIRSRRPAEVTVSGLASLPKIAAPNSASGTRESPYNYQSNTERDAFLTSQQLFVKNKPVEDSARKQTNSTALTTRKTSPRRPSPKKSKVRMSVETNAVIQKHVDALNAERFGRTKLSTENWIPDLIRRQSIEREIQVVKETTRDWEIVEKMQERQLKDILKSDVERAKMEKRIRYFEKMERREHVADIPCGCCRVEFLAVNLPLKVSQKAIIDFRIKIKGQLNSYSVFGKIKPITNSGKEDDEEEMKSPKAAKKDLSDIEVENHARRYSVVPRCYDEVAVCFFCSQFFENPEEYRPPFQRIYHEERVAREQELKRIEEEYWDPLKMSEKFREQEERELLAKLREEEELETASRTLQIEDRAPDPTAAISAGAGGVGGGAGAGGSNDAADSNLNEFDNNAS